MGNVYMPIITYYLCNSADFIYAISNFLKSYPVVLMLMNHFCISHHHAFVVRLFRIIFYHLVFISSSCFYNSYKIWSLFRFISIVVYKSATGSLTITAQYIQWNLSVTTTSIIKFITCDLFSNVFKWWLNVPTYACRQFLPSGAYLGGPWPPRWAPECREVPH